MRCIMCGRKDHGFFVRIEGGGMVDLECQRQLIMPHPFIGVLIKAFRAYTAALNPDTTEVSERVTTDADEIDG